MKTAPAEARLDRMIAKFTPAVARLAKTVIGKMRQQLPHATAMVYDNYNFLVVGFGPTESASEAVLSAVSMHNGLKTGWI